MEEEGAGEGEDAGGEGAAEVVVREVEEAWVGAGGGEGGGGGVEAGWGGGVEEGGYVDCGEWGCGWGGGHGGGRWSGVDGRIGVLAWGVDRCLYVFFC